jgi:hypothetical protein
MSETNVIHHAAGGLVELARCSFRNEPGSREDFDEGVRFVVEELPEYSSYIARHLIGILAGSEAVMRASAAEGATVQPIFLRTGFAELDALLDQHIRIKAITAVEGESSPQVLKLIENLNDAYFDGFNLNTGHIITALVQIPKKIAHHEDRRHVTLVKWTP